MMVGAMTSPGPIHAMKKILLLLKFPLLVLSSMTVLHAADAPARQLDVAAGKPVRSEIRHSMMGPRSTLLFYRFDASKAVLVLHIDNRNTEFAISGKVHLFGDGTTGEGLDRWINNQHSDGLFPDVPEPVAVHELPAAGFKILGVKDQGKTEQSPLDQTVFVEHKVDFRVAARDVIDGPVHFSLKTFDDSASVLVKR